MSQQLARLRAENLVKTRRVAKTIHYSLSSTEAVLVIQLLYKLFCAPEEGPVITLSREMAPAE